MNRIEFNVNDGYKKGTAVFYVDAHPRSGLLLMKEVEDILTVHGHPLDYDIFKKVFEALPQMSPADWRRWLEEYEDKEDKDETGSR